MATLSKKQRMATAIIEEAKILAESRDRLANLTQEYYDGGYNSGGSEEIDDADVAVMDTTAADLAGGITAFEQTVKLLDGEITAQSQYRINLAKLRRAGA